MAINLEKGGRINLEKEAPGLKKVLIGLGWDGNPTDTGAEFDLDASAFLLDAADKLTVDGGFVFYNNLKSFDGSLVHSGDNRTGAGDGDDEMLTLELAKVDAAIVNIPFVVTIHQAAQRGQNFGQVRNAYVRLVDAETNKEIAKYELDEDFSAETAVEFGRLYKKDGEWRFQAVGAGFKTGLDAFVSKYSK